MTETPLEALIARLEAATGPDLEIDDAIARAIFWEGGPVYANTPAYTASLDAALSLVDRGYWQIQGPERYLNIPSPVPNYWRASLITKDGTDVIAWGATAPLAVSSAALRARAALTREEG